MAYDSTDETMHHIIKVQDNIDAVLRNLDDRALVHDSSKLEPPEKGAFDEWTPRLRDVEYGSSEYQEYLDALAPALAHHYEVNDHHPEHYGEIGVYGMSLMSLLEMLADWKAASERTKDGSLKKSIDHNVGRFNIPPVMETLLWNTARELGWLDG